MTRTKNAPSFDLTLFTNHGGVLTKTLYEEHGKIKSEAPKMYAGIASRVRTTLDALPDLIASMGHDQCFATGVIDGDVERAEILTASEFERRGYQYPVTKDATGVYSTRSKQSMVQRGPSLIMFDHDHDPSCDERIQTPEEFLKLLDKAVPELNLLNTSYVRTYSTSTSLYDKETGKCIVPPNGFHIYMVVKEGADVPRFAEVLNQRCWLAGLGHIKVSSNGSRLPRTVFDTAVFQPERLCFEAGAFISDKERFYQQLPRPEYVEGKTTFINTKLLKTLNPEEQNQFRLVQTQIRNSAEVMAKVEEVRETNVQRLVNSTHYSDTPMTRKEAERVVLARERKILHPRDILEFADGRKTTLIEAYLRADEFDQCAVIDPLRPDKGFGRAIFYANRSERGNILNPMIHSFIEGGRVYSLRESLDEFMSPAVVTDCGLEKFDKKALVVDQRYFPKLELKDGINCIKGEKGTGKTEAISAASMETEGRVLAISHLITLDSSICRRFDLTSYNKVERSAIHMLRSQKRLGICYNSLYKLAGQKYDLVIMDEFTQVLRHMKSTTVDKPVACLHTLRQILKDAKKVVVMDADLTSEHIDEAFNPEHGIFAQGTPVHVVVNQYKPAAEQEREVVLYKHEDDKPAEAQFLERLYDEGTKRGVFYASNSKGDVLRKAALMIKKLGGDPHIESEHFITEVAGRRVITITGNNSQLPEVDEFIKDINGNLRPDDLLFSSPSIGTGVSIDAVDNKPVFDVTFGYFTKQAQNLPTDCCQHLSRVRECQNFHIMYKDNARRDPESAAEIVATEVLGKKHTVDNHLRVQVMAEYDEATKSIKTSDHGWTSWYGFLKSHENKQRNNFGKALEAKLLEEGYKVSNVFDGTLLGFQLQELIGTLDKDLKAIEKEKLESTPLITDDEYAELSELFTVNAEERRKLFKKRLANTFGFLEDDGDLNALVTESTGSITARRKALILGGQADHLLLLDIVNRLDIDRYDHDKTALYDYQKLLRGFLAIFGVTFENDIPNYDDREIGALQKHLAFEFLMENERDFKVLHGIKIGHPKTDKEKNALVGRVLQSLGFKYSKKKARVGGVSTWVYFLCNNRIQRCINDILRAQRYSKSTIFAGLEELPGILKGYWFQYRAGTPDKSPFWPYLRRLPDLELARVHRILEQQYLELLTQAA